MSTCLRNQSMHEWRSGLSLAQFPASTERPRLSYGPDEVAALSARLQEIPPKER